MRSRSALTLGYRRSIRSIPAALHERWERTGRRRAASTAAPYVSADDGFLYRLGLGGGEERWRVRLVEQPIVRLPFDDPKTRFDRFGADVAVDGGRLYVGTHDGRVVALDAQRGATLWEFATGGSVLGAPVVALRRVYAGSYDGWLYALDAATRRRDLAARHARRRGVDAGDRRRAPADRQPRYDLLALDARSGETAWKRYLGFAGTAAGGEGLVFFAGLDGRVYAFSE